MYGPSLLVKFRNQCCRTSDHSPPDGRHDRCVVAQSPGAAIRFPVPRVGWDLVEVPDGQVCVTVLVATRAL